MSISRPIATDADIQTGLKALISADARLARIIDKAGDVPLRRIRGGFYGLAQIIISQQVSKQSAEAITARFHQHIPDATPQTFLAADDETLRMIGLSRPKQRTLRATADAMTTGALDLNMCANVKADEAILHLTTVKGIGPWTAEVYLLFCAGHPDIFPAGDLALRIAAHEALGLDERPSDAALRDIAESWSPWRGVAARVFWSWYGQKRSRAVMP